MFWNCYILLVLMASTSCGLNNVEFSSNGKGSSVNIIEKGVVVAGKSNIIFSVKACHSAVFVLSDIIGISNTTGRYFIIMYGTARNKLVMAYDSCFSCSLTKQIRAEVMDCDKYKSFWVRWDKDGNVDTGSGTTVGTNTLLALDGFYEDYNFNTAAVTTTGGALAQWRFTATETATEFFSPSPGGTTKVEVSESITVGSKVLNFTIKPPDDDVTYIVTGDGADNFVVENTSLVIGKPLDYEKEQFHTLTIGTNIGVSTSMTVVVKNEVDEGPVINVTGVLHIPEELPVGTVLWWNRTVSDPDVNDTLSYTLTGPLSEILTMTSSGDINVTQRIDREALNSSIINSTATLTVTDSSGLKVETEVQILIDNVNDNAPAFNKTLIEVDVIENTSSDVVLLNLGDYIDDDDDEEGQHAVFNFSISSEDSSSFYVNGSVLYVRANSLDLETSPAHYTTLTVEASDLPATGVARTGTVVLLVKILPRDEHEPSWRAPSMESNTTFRDVEISKSIPPGTLVTVFRVRDEDKGEFPFFSLNTLESDGSNFHVDSETGELKTKDVIGQDSYTITVVATTGNRTINGTITVNIKGALGTSGFKFRRSIFIIKEPKKKDIGRTLLVLSVLNRGNASRVKIIMDEKGSEVFNLEPMDKKWKLMLRDDFYNHSQVSFPTVVILSAFAHGIDQQASAYIVIDGHIVQRDPRTTSTTLKTTLRHRNTTNATTVNITAPTSTTSSTTTSTKATSAITTSDVMSSSVSVKHTACDAAGTGPVAVLSSIAAIQGASLIGVLTYMFAARHKRKKNSVEPERSEPVGCEPDKKDSSEKVESKSTTESKDQIDTDSTMLEIVDETTSHDLKAELGYNNERNEIKNKTVRGEEIEDKLGGENESENGENKDENGGKNKGENGSENKDENGSETKGEEDDESKDGPEDDNGKQLTNKEDKTKKSDNVQIANDDVYTENGLRKHLANTKSDPEETKGENDSDVDTERGNDPRSEMPEESIDPENVKDVSHDAKGKIESEDEVFDDDFENKTVHKLETNAKGWSPVNTDKDCVRNDDSVDEMSAAKDMSVSDQRKEQINVDKDVDSIFNDKNTSIDDNEFGQSKNRNTSERLACKSTPNTDKHVDFFDDFYDKPGITPKSISSTPDDLQHDFDYTMNKIAEHNSTALTEPEKKSSFGKTDDDYLQKHTLKRHLEKRPLHPGNTSPASLLTDHEELLTRKPDEVTEMYTTQSKKDPKSSLKDTAKYDTSLKSNKTPKRKDVFEPVTAVGVIAKSKATAAAISDGSDSAEDSDEDSEDDDHAEHAVVVNQRAKPSSKSVSKTRDRVSSKLDSATVSTGNAAEAEPASKKGKKKKKGRKKQSGEKKSKAKPKKGGSKKSSKTNKKK